jgi:hypothetical protein
MLADIRCGCGGRCDAGSLCTLRAQVRSCECGSRPIHARRQHVLADIWNSAIVADLVEDSCERCTRGLFCRSTSGRGAEAWSGSKAAICTAAERVATSLPIAGRASAIARVHFVRQPRSNGSGAHTPTIHAQQKRRAHGQVCGQLSSTPKAALAKLRAWMAQERTKW